MLSCYSAIDGGRVPHLPFHVRKDETMIGESAVESSRSCFCWYLYDNMCHMWHVYMFMHFYVQLHGIFMHFYRDIIIYVTRCPSSSSTTVGSEQVQGDCWLHPFLGCLRSRISIDHLRKTQLPLTKKHILYALGISTLCSIYVPAKKMAHGSWGYAPHGE